MLQVVYVGLLIFLTVNCGSPREESTQLKSLDLAGNNNQSEISEQTEEKILGVNALNLIDDHTFEEKNHLGKRHWQETIDYAAWLNAKFIVLLQAMSQGS